MNAASVLSEALSLIAAPSRWTKEAVARDERQNECKPTDERARSYDMVGALQRVECPSTAYGEAVRFLRQQCGEQSIFEFNDGHGHKAVLTCFKRAIRAAEAA